MVRVSAALTAGLARRGWLPAPPRPDERPGTGPVTVIEVGEKVVPLLDLAEPFAVEGLAGKLLVKAGEAQEMLPHPLAGVAGAGFGSQQKGPIAGLRQQQLARGLLERALLNGVRPRETPGQLGHPLLGGAQVGIDPLVLLVEPDAPIAALAPA